MKGGEDEGHATTLGKFNSKVSIVCWVMGDAERKGL